MENPNMLYRCPGTEVFEGVQCETTTVDDSDVDAALADGWHRDWMQADAAHKEAAAQLKANEEEQARIAAQLKDAGGSDLTGAGGLKAVHKGRGVYEVQDAAGAVVKTGLTKDEAQAAVLT